MKHKPLVRAFTLVELLVVIGIIGLLLAILLPTLARVRHQSKKILCMNNLRQLVAADIMYSNTHKRLYPVSNFVPSSIAPERLRQIGTFYKLPVPDGPVNTWPKREEQPLWYNCPIAHDSNFAQGMTLGGGVYTGYVYVGGIEASGMVTSGLAQLPPGHHAANLKLTKRGVVWADILDEYYTPDDRRYEFFHRDRKRIKSGYTDFRLYSTELEGIHRAWSDGSVDWFARDEIDFKPNSRDVQIIHAMGKYYY